ncbi:hypothetical protein B0H15DRAFT_956202 [Mycena belliarum]|uniref:Uncharacterized protein n=1 Tax=Mycena belliarum TaxID=1033014 RepID=A0AAD6XJJ2_9AGAR|nr:hypothetical protein B0H15DRAFT_956202 [Mycena belliae]
MLRQKARERMARNRRLLKQMPKEDQEEARERAREVQARYRKRNRLELAQAQSCRRMEAFIEKYGQEAWDTKVESRWNKIKARADQVRRARKQAQGSTKRAAQAREKAARRAKGQS